LPADANRWGTISKAAERSQQLGERLVGSGRASRVVRDVVMLDRQSNKRRWDRPTLFGRVDTYIDEGLAGR
jgi:hypothetical protein